VLVRLLSKPQQIVFTARQAESMIEVWPTAKAPLMGLFPKMRAFQAMASTWLNPGAPERTGTTRRLAARVVG
jgi:hypothetical protein